MLDWLIDWLIDFFFDKGQIYTIYMQINHFEK